MHAGQRKNDDATPGRGRIAVAATALVVLGAAVGITADRLLNSRPQVEAARLSDGTVIRTSDLQADPIEAIDRAVGLRPEQRARIAAIIDRRQSDLDAAWHEARTRILATVDSVIAEVAAELDPDQAERFRAFHDELYGPSHGEHHLPQRHRFHAPSPPLPSHRVNGPPRPVVQPDEASAYPRPPTPTLATRREDRLMNDGLYRDADLEVLAAELPVTPRDAPPDTVVLLNEDEAGRGSRAGAAPNAQRNGS